MKKLFAVLLTLAMLLGLAACGIVPEKVTIVGSWKGSIDMSKILSDYTEMDFDEPICFDIVLSFHEDDTYTAKVDTDSLKAAMKKAAELVVEKMIETFGGEGQDFDEMLAAEGMTREEFVEQIMNSMDLENSMGDTETLGYYKFENGKLFFAEDREDLETVDVTNCLHVTLESKTLTITEIESDGEKASEVMPNLFPWVFKKQ